MTLKELRQQRAAKASRGKAALSEFNALSTKETRTPEEEARMAALSTELDALETEVADLEAQLEAAETQARRATLFASGARAAAGQAARTQNEPNPVTTGGFHSMAEMAVSVRNAVVNHQVDPRLLGIESAEGNGLGAAPTNFHQNQGAAGEGFLVPLEFRQTIWELTFDGSDLLGMITPEPTNSNAISIGKDESTPWGANGVQARWRAEASQMDPSKTAVNQSLMQLHELYAFVLASDEVLADAPRLQSRLTNQAARAIRWQASDAIMWGDGNGKPLGFMNAPGLVTVAKESGQAADSFVVKNITKMSSRLLRMGGRPIWLANSDIEPQLADLTIGNIPAFLPNNQPLADSPYEGSIRGKPLYYNEHNRSLGDLGDICLWDPTGYFAATKAGGGIDFAASIHLYFDYGMSAFRWTFRMGGQPFLSAPVSPANGSTTKSQFVTLAERA